MKDSRRRTEHCDPVAAHRTRGEDRKRRGTASAHRTGAGTEGQGEETSGYHSLTHGRTMLRFIFAAKKKMMLLTKENIQYASAIAMLVSGSVMCYLNMYLPPVGEISSGALWYAGQTFLFAGAVFGFGAWANTKAQDIRQEMLELIKDNKNGKNDTGDKAEAQQAG